MRIGSPLVQVQDPSPLNEKKTLPPKELLKEEKTFSRKELVKLFLFATSTLVLPFVAARIWNHGRAVAHLRNQAVNEYSQCLVDIETQVVDPNPDYAETLKSMQKYYDNMVEEANASIHPYFYYASAISTLAISCFTNYLTTKYSPEENKMSGFAVRAGIQSLWFIIGCRPSI